MRRFACIHAIILVLLTLTGCSAVRNDRDTLYQVSTLSALLEGVYDGETTFAELKTHGDFGIGTFNALDGEMICVDGHTYQVKADGRAYAVGDRMKTPFACVTFFDADRALPLPEGMDFEGLTRHLDQALPTVNLPYAIRIRGTFSYVKTRSVPAQTRPYPRLVEVVKNQPTFEFQNVKGVMAGFRLPQYLGGINVPAYHIHFLNEDATAGGHVLKLVVQKASVELDLTPRLTLVLPVESSFSEADLSPQKAEEVERVEK